MLLWLAIHVDPNRITLVVVHSLMTAEPRRNPALSGEMRCVWTFEENSFKLKWYAQLIQHVLMASLFCWPLLEHMARMRQNAIKGSSSTHSVYSSLVIRAVAAMLVSTTFCAIISALALARIEDPTLEVPSYSLAILDNAITLASIFYAMNISTAPEEDKSYKVALTSVNSNTASHRSSSFSAPHSSSVQAQV
jgi:glycerol uptake facilitator-like aquaporin